MSASPMSRAFACSTIGLNLLRASLIRVSTLAGILVIRGEADRKALLRQVQQTLFPRYSVKTSRKEKNLAQFLQASLCGAPAREAVGAGG